MQLAYLPVGAPTFDLVAAQEQFDKSVSLLRECMGSDVSVPEKMLLSVADLKDFLSKIHPDLIVFQGITFANAAFVSEVIAAFPDCPILMWTLAEPAIDGKRLRLNSLTGAFSAANAMHALGRPDFGYIFGSPEDKRVKKAIISNIKAIEAKLALKATNCAAIGHTPQGFGFGRALDADLMFGFGLRLMSIEARELIEKAKSFNAEDCKEYADEFRKACCGVDNIPQENLEGFVRLFKAYTEFCRENNVGIIASRCWPDFFTSFGTPVCAVLSMLNDRGVISACESDIYGAVSMFIANKMSGNSVFFGDPVSMNEAESTITFWHCGMCAPSLACKAELGVHPNRKIGPVMDFACKASEASTIFRIGRNPDGSFRAFICRGKAIEKPKQFQGTSVVIKTDNSAYDIINDAVKDGWEPHYAVAYGDITDELEAFCRIMGIEACRY